MTDDELRAEITRVLFNGLDRPLELVVVTKRHEDVEKLVRDLAEVKEKLERMNHDYYRMSTYAELYIRALDDLRECERLLRNAGIKCDIGSLRTPIN